MPDLDRNRSIGDNQFSPSSTKSVPVGGLVDVCRSKHILKYYRVPPGLYIWTSTILTVLAVSARDRSTGLPDSKSAQVIRSNSSWSSLYVRLRFSEIRYESCHTRKITPLVTSDDHPLSSAISISGNSKIYGIPKYVLSICVFSIHLQRSGLGIQNSTKCVFPARSIISIRS